MRKKKEAISPNFCADVCTIMAKRNLKKYQNSLDYLRILLRHYATRTSVPEMDLLERA